jgi:hypothetical protein
MCAAAQCTPLCKGDMCNISDTQNTNSYGHVVAFAAALDAAPDWKQTVSNDNHMQLP